MAFLISRRHLFSDGSFGGCVYCFNPVDGHWSCFGIDGFSMFVHDYCMEPVSIFCRPVDDAYFEYTLYSFPSEAYKEVLDILC